jgi:L-lactate dehydrogenase
VIASNPVDVLTWMMQELSARPDARVIGTGTMLDTSRFRTLLGGWYDVDPRSVHGYILGEHGDSEFAAWSTVTIGGMRAVNSEVLGRPWDADAMQALFVEVRDAAYGIIRGKGYTNLAIGLVISRLVEIVLQDRRSVQPVSVRLHGEYGLSEVCISVPCRVGQGGVGALVELPLPPVEQAALEASAAVMKRSIAGVALGG